MQRRLVPFGQPLQITSYSSGSSNPVDTLTEKQFIRAVKKFEKEKRRHKK